MATPTYATVINQINTYIVANANNEITANVLNPILKVITDFANNTIGELTDLTTTDTDTIVGAINSLKIAFENLNNNGIQLSTGYTDPNVTPPASYGYGDFYMELDIIGDVPIQLWQWNGTEWTTYSSVYTKAEIDYLLSNYYTKSELLTQIGLLSSGENELIEKGFNHVINFDWFVFAQVYRFNGVLTENLVTDTITISPAPTTLDFKRFDVIVFNDNFTFSVVEGDEGLNPAIPKIDIKKQIQLTVILVEYGTTSPSYLTKQLMYDEGVGLPTEFAVTKTGTTITIDSLEQPSSGTKSIKVANPINSDVLFLDKNVTFNSLDVDTITFKVKNSSAGNWRFHLYSYNSIDGFYQGTATIKNGSYGYSSNNITDHQTIIVPISKILGTGEIHNTGFAMTFYNSSLGTFYFDEFALNGNFTQAPALTNPLTYLELTDTNNSYAGHAGKVPKVNVGETALAFENLTKSDVDLSNVDNTSDANKPVSSATQTALNLKLDASAYNQHFKGKYLTAVAMRAAHPTASVGDSAQVNEVGATTVVNYSWDDELGDWVITGSVSGGATNTDELPEGTVNLYFNTARVLATVLTGISFLTGTAVVATDTVLEAFGKLQKQITDLTTAVGLNTAKVTNATHTGEVTGSGALTIESGVVDRDNLHVSLKTRITNAAVTGTYTLDHALGNDWKLTLTGITTIAESNLPTGTDTLEFTMKVTGNFGLTVPAYWTVLGDTYDGTKWNFFTVQIHKGDATQEATCFISNF